MLFLVTAVKHWHGVPRFGHSDDVADLTGSSSEMTDYILGTIFVAGFIIASLLVWLLVQSVLLCINNCPRERNRVERIVSPKTKLMMQYVFIVCGFTGILGTILYLTIGLPIAKKAIITLQTEIDEVQSILVDTNCIFGDLSTISTNTMLLRDELSDNLSLFCANNSDARIFPRINLQTKVESIISSLEKFPDVVHSNLVQIQDGIIGAINAISQLDNYLEMAKSILNALVYFFVVAIFVIFLSISLTYVECGRDSTIQFRFIPVFVLPSFTLIISFMLSIAAALFSIFSVINADFCEGDGSPPSPPRSILNILLLQGFKVGSSIHEAVSYYIVDYCVGISPFEFLSKFRSKINDLAQSYGFDGAIDGNALDQMTIVCGKDGNYFTEEIHSISYFIETNREGIITLVDDLFGNDGLLTCERLLPIYHVAINESICYDMMKTWHFLFILLMSLSVLFVIDLSLQLSRKAYTRTPSVIVDEICVDKSAEKKNNDICHNNQYNRAIDRDSTTLAITVEADNDDSTKIETGKIDKEVLFIQSTLKPNT